MILNDPKICNYDLYLFSEVICMQCGKTFSFPNYLQKHITRVHGPKRLPRYKCRQCPLRFDSDVMLHVHMQSHPKVYFIVYV